LRSILTSFEPYDIIHVMYQQHKRCIPYDTTLVCYESQLRRVTLWLLLGRWKDSILVVRLYNDEIRDRERYTHTNIPVSCRGFQSRTLENYRLGDRSLFWQVGQTKIFHLLKDITMPRATYTQTARHTHDSDKSRRPMICCWSSPVYRIIL